MSMVISLHYGDCYPEWRVLEDEIRLGFQQIHKLISSCYTGDYGDTQPLVPREGYLSAAAYKAYSYAVEGVVDGNQFSTDEQQDLIAFCKTARVAGELYTDGDFPESVEVLLYTVLARSKVDRARGLEVYDFDLFTDWFENGSREELSLSEVAMLAGMSEMAVRNATRSSGTDHLQTIKVEGRVYVEPDIAHSWLCTRQSFRPTQMVASMADDEVLVPFAKDGTFFSGRCARKSGYQIGAKGHEKYYSDLYEALAELKKMPKARWRRPNSSGNYGIVSVTEWKAVSKADFEAKS